MTGQQQQEGEQKNIQSLEKPASPIAVEFPTPAPTSAVPSQRQSNGAFQSIQLEALPDAWASHASLTCAARGKRPALSLQLHYRYSVKQSKTKQRAAPSAPSTITMSIVSLLSNRSGKSTADTVHVFMVTDAVTSVDSEHQGEAPLVPDLQPEPERIKINNIEATPAGSPSSADQLERLNAITTVWNTKGGRVAYIAGVMKQRRKKPPPPPGTYGVSLSLLLYCVQLAVFSFIMM